MWAGKEKDRLKSVFKKNSAFLGFPGISGKNYSCFSSA
jgi:hypothetical protein